MNAERNGNFRLVSSNWSAGWWGMRQEGEGEVLEGPVITLRNCREGTHYKVHFRKNLAGVRLYTEKSGIELLK